MELLFGTFIISSILISLSVFKDRLQDYKTREEGCITKMLADLEFYLKERRSMNRLIFFYKVVEGLVPPIPPEDFLKLIRQKDT